MHERANTDWFLDAGWGVFMHFLAHPASYQGTVDTTAEDWNRRVDAFDTEALAAQLEDIKAGYFFITLGQNTGFYCTPNTTYDNLVKRTPSHCSRRDLVADLIASLAPRGIRVMVYLPSHAPADDMQAVENLACTPPWDASQWQLRPGRYRNERNVDARLTEFQRNWEAVIREWSDRWGRDVHGWWFDGCYYADRIYRSPDEPNFRSFAAAVKSGNPASLVAFNPGVKVPLVSMTEYEDYTAGEVADILPTTCSAPWNPPVDRYVDGAQRHILTYIGQYWGQGEPRFCNEFAAGYTRDVLANKGVITWDTPFQPDGTLTEPAMERFRAIRDLTRA